MRIAGSLASLISLGSFDSSGEVLGMGQSPRKNNSWQ